jgi:ubiquinone/menaquinone biosynthesis C-methylase UbiE
LAGALSFSEVPLRLAIWCGLAVSALAMLYGIYVMAAWLAKDAFHPFARGMFSRLYGTDISAASIAQARQNHPDVEYQAYDGNILPYGDGTFDLAVTICVLHHVPPQRWFGFLREIRRVVRPGGLVCVIEHNPLNPLTRLAVMRCEFDRDAALLRAGQTRRLLEDAGLRRIDTRYFVLLPWATPLMRRIERSLRNLQFGSPAALSDALQR